MLVKEAASGPGGKGAAGKAVSAEGLKESTEPGGSSLDRDMARADVVVQKPQASEEDEESDEEEEESSSEEEEEESSSSSDSSSEEEEDDNDDEKGARGKGTSNPASGVGRSDGKGGGGSGGLFGTQDSRPLEPHEDHMQLTQMMQVGRGRPHSRLMQIRLTITELSCAPYLLLPPLLTDCLTH